ncbi:glycosyltransferase family 25 protein [Knoellia sp. CPCC 206450]|uniref:glycosyltransferase family 25 protein n=1 Tax=Knoellia tibetensis TaxID=3404798 RepID=UPI003B42CE92
MHAYVINLERSPNRRAHITRELARTGLTHDIVTGVDGQGLDLGDRATIAPELLAKNDFPAGSAGCALSHLQVYRRILEDGHEHALVLEDDVTLPADLGTIVEQVVPHLTGAEVVLLNYGSRDGVVLAREGSVRLSATRTLALPVDIASIVNAGAYVITRDACRRMVAGLLPLRANADEWDYLYEQGLLDRVRLLRPLPVTKNASFESTIGLYSLGSGVASRLVASVLRRRIPLVHRLVLWRRQRILGQWERSEVVDAPFTTRPSRLD